MFLYLTVCYKKARTLLTNAKNFKLVLRKLCCKELYYVFSQGVWLYYLMQLQYFSLDIPFITQPATTVTITNPYIDSADYCLLIYRSGSGGCTVRGVAVFKQLRPPKAPFAWGGESRALIGPHPSFAPTQALQH